MRFLDAEAVVNLHDAILARTGGERGVLQRGMLEAGLDRCQHGPFPTTPDLCLRAAFLVRSIAQDHPFADGNKRTAFEAADTFLFHNGFIIHAESRAIVHFMLEVARGELDVDAIAEWLRSHLGKLEKEGG